MGYPDVRVFNSTPFAASGGVNYAVCSDDAFSIRKHKDWSHSRGLCLITRVYASLSVDGDFVEATPYTSTGTSYSQFSIIQTGPQSFAVTRITVGHDSQKKYRR